MGTMSAVSSPLPMQFLPLIGPLAALWMVSMMVVILLPAFKTARRRAFPPEK